VKWRNKKQRGPKREFLESFLAEFVWRKQFAGSDVFKALILAIWPPESQM